MPATAQPSRRSLLALALSAPLAGTVLAACGDSGPAGSSGSGASIWILTGAPGEGIRTAIGANQSPTIIWTWGGGGLRDYVENGQVEDLTSFFSENAALKDKLFTSAFGAATVDDKVYAVPCENVSPIVMFYNKRAFEKVGAQIPTTWDEVMALVPTFNAAGIAPFSLGGQSRWTNMMWLEFLYDRIGGAELFQSIYAGTPDAWSNPDSIAALTAVQDLVRANGFITGFASVTADSNADQALLYTDKAAMMLHGAWTYGAMKSEGGDFVTGGHLAWSTFPTVTGGKGDPTNTVGNPSSYYALSSKASEEAKTAAKKYFAEGLVTDATTKAWVEAGSVPIVNGSDSMFAGSEDEEWLQFVYDTASGAASFQQSWDQALSPTQAETLLDNIEKLFGLTITPEEFATNMNASITGA